jgi:hypothetical protein
MDAPEYSSVQDNPSDENDDGRRTESCCLNCGAILTGTYCAQCGQKDIPLRQTLSELVYNFLSSFSGYESKFFKTCRYLLLKPGFLATEYNAGRRERYFHPARMYAFISVIYFFLFAALPDADKSGAVLKITKDGKDIDYYSGEAIDFGTTFETRQYYDSVQSRLPAEERDGWLKRKLKYKAFSVRERFAGNPGEFTSHVLQDFTSHFSVVFFFLLPVFAFILWLFYNKRNFYYSEHLVFSICYYNFFFLVGSLAMLLETVSWLSWLAALLDITIFIYLLLALKRAYREGWGRTLLKFAAFTVVFGICILFGLLVNLSITLMLI